MATSNASRVLSTDTEKFGVRKDNPRVYIVDNKGTEWRHVLRNKNHQNVPTAKMSILPHIRFASREQRQSKRRHD